MKALLHATCAALLVIAMSAGNVRAEQGPDQAQMTITGTISVDAAGNVTGYDLRHRDRLPASVTKLVQSTIAGWRFEPVLRNGMAVPAKADMRLAVTAKPTGTGEYTLAVSSRWFGTSRDASKIRVAERVPPHYPELAIRERVAGTVWVVALLDAEGHVAKAAAEQVNLRRIGSDRDMQRWRQWLSDASLTAVRKWTFKLPSSSPEARCVVRIPIDYALASRTRSQRSALDTDGHWVSYLPGPVNPIPWLHQDEARADNSAMPVHGVFLAGTGDLKLVEPAGG